jgi:hypothetical protein
MKLSKNNHRRFQPAGAMQIGVPKRPQLQVFLRCSKPMWRPLNLRAERCTGPFPADQVRPARRHHDRGDCGSDGADAPVARRRGGARLTRATPSAPSRASPHAPRPTTAKWMILEHPGRVTSLLCRKHLFASNGSGGTPTPKPGAPAASAITLASAARISGSRSACHRATSCVTTCWCSDHRCEKWRRNPRVLRSRRTKRNTPSEKICPGRRDAGGSRANTVGDPTLCQAAIISM